MKNFAFAAAGLAALAFVPAMAVAHHSGAMFDSSKQATFEGTVKEFQYTNPHSWLEVDVPDAKGKVTTWGFENEGPSTLLRSGIKKSTFPPGQKLLVVGNPLKDGRPGGHFVCAKLPDGTVFGGRAGPNGEPAQCPPPARAGRA